MIRKLPNTITIFRITSSASIPLLIAAGDEDLRFFGLVLFTIAAITDWLDGMLARQFDAVSNLGRMLDPIADKLLVAGCLLALAVSDNWGWLMFLPALLILFREVFISGLREFMAGKQVVIHVTPLAKIKTTLQLIAIGFAIGSPLTPTEWYIANITVGLMWTASILTMMTGWDYFRKAISHDASA
ncbi:CDP-diacylglycerol--glycerol-3-phosphate 3-phosphatidyltransferase [Alphaproteobacteria bacterium LSUCC0684]